MSKQQIVVDDFVHEYNTVKPHEALEMNKPANVHFISEIEICEKYTPFDYPLHFKVIK